jgi:catechol 2,3-dioxygenase-like lactoylglutathione lyase family enzyme
MRTIPALPVRDVRAAADRYRDKFGFGPVHVTDDYAVVVRGEAELHLWGAADEEWRSRTNVAEKPVCSGAESFLAGTASCRIEVAEVDALFEELDAAGVSHPTAGGLNDTDFGTREFATLDMDGNLLVFFRRVGG